MNPPIRLGIIGSSPGNGHPFSWSSIINGYDRFFYQYSGYPQILQYLDLASANTKTFTNSRVTHVWTQDQQLTDLIAKCSLIPYTCSSIEEMIGHVDAILYARDDSHNHLQYTSPFIRAGLPIFIDKPLATTLTEAYKIFDLERYPGQIYSCSALKYASELSLDTICRVHPYTIRHISAHSPKYWPQYGIHMIEPVLQLLGTDLSVIDQKVHVTPTSTTVSVRFSNDQTASFSTHGNCQIPIYLDIKSNHRRTFHIFYDSYSCFRQSLDHFIKCTLNQTEARSRHSMLKSISILQIPFVS